MITLGLGLIGGPARASGVAANRASDVMTLVTSNSAGGINPSAVCPTSSVGRVFDYRILSDGTRAPFVLPPGRVFVVTGLEVSSDSSPGQSVAVTLRHASSGEAVFFAVEDAHDFGLTGAGVRVNAPISNLVARDPLCAEIDSGPTPQLFAALLHGFLVADR